MIEVTADTLRVGRAVIPRALLGEIRGYDGDAATQQRGPKLDARAWLCIRGWVKPVVKIAITDPSDPVPYWLVSTRHPNELIRSLGGNPAETPSPSAQIPTPKRRRRMKCPIDDTTLLISNREGIEIDYCPQCRGVWLDRGELDKIVERSAPAVAEQTRGNYGRDDHGSDHDRKRSSGHGYDGSSHGGQKRRGRESWLGDLFG
ncbi:DUF3093 family protein [Herbiconiux sp. A18JL235]|uniref:DUF3093 family protein n=1 Tax=Herbiconiux sp. A18JL235 TaxID=3152363 RepID=A0AB39BMN5_9MICO